MSQPSPRVNWMDALRGAMILLVIFFHAAGRIQRYEPEAIEYIGYFNLFWEPFRMPVLVILSGMLLARSLAKARGQVRDRQSSSASLALPRMVDRVHRASLRHGGGSEP